MDYPYATHKATGWLPATDEILIDLGLMDPPPIDEATRRRWRWQALSGARSFMPSPLP